MRQHSFYYIIKFEKSKGYFFGSAKKKRKTEKITKRYLHLKKKYAIITDSNSKGGDNRATYDDWIYGTR